jgi:2-succinyl-6-hydroxy-2,4-cyclohexadiene-1-carboxylate synthase
LLHGFAGDPANWDDVAITGARIALPGHLGGGRVATSWDANLRAIAARLAGAEVAIGYSLGARVALGLVAAGFVPRAVLISVNPGIADADRAARRAGDAQWAARLREHGLTDFLATWQAQPLFASQAGAPADRRAARAARRQTLDADQLARSLETMGLAEMPDYRAAVDARVALIAGADDAKFVAIARALPVPVELIEDCGHDPTLEQPAALTAAIARALARFTDAV